MTGRDHRKAGAGDRADGTGGRTASPDEIATAFGRIADDLALLAPLPGEPETGAPSLEDPWEDAAADALVRLYESGEAGLARPLSADAELQLRLSRIASQAAASHPPQAGIDAIGGPAIESRLTAIAGHIEAALARLEATSDAGGLRIIEAHAGEILAHAQEARTHLGRLAGIEAELGELRASLADSRLAGLMGAARPTGDELTRLAEAAAQKALRTRADTVGDRSATARLNERAAEIQRSLARFIEEHRQGERQVADALETMQQAMQYILDRIDAIEGAQAAAGELPPDERPQPWGGEARPAHTPVPGSVEDARAREPLRGEPAWDDLEQADQRTSAGSEGDPVGARARLATEKAAFEENLRPLPTLGIRSGSARASGERRQVLRSGILVAASLAAFLLAGYWLASGPKLHPPGAIEAQTAGPVEPAERPAELRSFSAAIEDGAGQPPADRPVAGAPGQSIEHQTSTERSGLPETQAQHGEGDTVGAASGLQGPIGVVIEQGGTTLSPEELLRLRQRQRMANLSTRLGQHGLDTPVQPIMAKADAADLARPDALRAGATAPARVSVELPPLMIGPHSLRHAAANGDASAQFEVAARFAEGRGVKQDFAQAAVWYQRAATQGFAAAQYRLATLYERGVGVASDPARARTWYQRAAEQGNLKAMHNLAVLSARSGQGAARDYAAAARWFGKAAARGLADSQYNLALLHENGLGVAKDAAAAYRWYALAARAGDKEAVRRRDLVKERLGASVLAAVEAELAAWVPLPADRLANDARAAGQAWQQRTATGVGE